MDSKEGIEKVAPVDAWVVGLPDPSVLRLGDASPAMTDLPREWVGSLVGLCPSPDKIPRRESYCLYIRVLKD